MEAINLQDFTEEAAYQVHAVLETISRLDERVEVYDGERLVGVILRGQPLPEDTASPTETEHRSPALGIDLSIEESLEQHQRRIE